MRFDRLMMLVEASESFGGFSILSEAVDFDSKPGFEAGTPLRAWVDKVLDSIAASKFKFEGMDQRYSDGFLLQRAKALSATDRQVDEIADTLVKFMYLLKFHTSELIADNVKLNLTSYSFDELRKIAEDLYGKYHAEDVKRQLAKVKSKSDKDKKVEAIEEGAEVVYEDAQFRILKITTKEASIKYGRNTSWCISSDGEKNYWNGYKDYIHYFILDKDYYDSVKSAPADVNPKMILSEYPTGKRPPYSKVVVSLSKKYGGFYEDYEASSRDDDDGDGGVSKISLVENVLGYQPTDENQDANDRRIKNDSLWEDILESEFNDGVYEFFNNIKEQDDKRLIGELSDAPINKLGSYPSVLDLIPRLPDAKSIEMAYTYPNSILYMKDPPHEAYVKVCEHFEKLRRIRGVQTPPDDMSAEQKAYHYLALYDRANVQKIMRHGGKLSMFTIREMLDKLGEFESFPLSELIQDGAVFTEEELLKYVVKKPHDIKYILNHIPKEHQEKFIIDGVKRNYNIFTRMLSVGGLTDNIILAAVEERPVETIRDMLKHDPRIEPSETVQMAAVTAPIKPRWYFEKSDRNRCLKIMLEHNFKPSEEVQRKAVQLDKDNLYDLYYHKQKPSREVKNIAIETNPKAIVVIRWYGELTEEDVALHNKRWGTSHTFEKVKQSGLPTTGP